MESNNINKQAEFKEAMELLSGFMSKRQISAVRELALGEEGNYFVEKMIELGQTIKNMPKSYEQDDKGEQGVAYLHYFIGGCDWYITEKDSEDEQFQAFGLSNLGHGSELGYISIVELQEVNAELDFHFTPKTVAEIKNEENDRMRAM